MTLEELIETYPEAETYFKNMPEELKTRYIIRKFPPGTIIHQKDYPLDYLILSAKLPFLRKNRSHPYPLKH